MKKDYKEKDTQKALSTQSQSLTSMEELEEIENPLAHLKPLQQRFVHMYMTGQYSQAQLAQLFDVHPNTIMNWLKTPEIREAIEEYQEVTHLVVQHEMKALTVKAMSRMRELMDSPIDGVALQAVKDILDRTGHKPKQTIEKNVNVRTFEEKLSDIIDATIEGEWEDVE